MQKAKHTNRVKACRHANTFPAWTQLTPFQLFPLTWQLGKASVENAAKRETITRGGGWGGPGFHSGQVPKRDCAGFLHETPISNHHPSVHWRMDHSPAPSLCLLSSFASYPLLFLRIKSTESLSLSSSLLLLCHGHHHMYTCNTTSQGRCPQSRDRGLVLANRWL